MPTSKTTRSKANQSSTTNYLETNSLTVSGNSIESQNKVEISVVSNSQLFREGLVALLSNYLEVNLTGSYNARAQQTIVLANPPNHVVLVDGGIGLDAVLDWTRYWHNQNPAAHVVVLELSNNSEQIMNCIEAGASGYTIQGTSVEQLSQVIMQARNGLAQCSLEVTARLFARIADYAVAQQPVSRLEAVPLTPRELEVLHYIAEDYSNQQIADALVIGVSTVKHHVHNILEKLKLSHRWEVSHFAREQGLVKLK